MQSNVHQLRVDLGLMLEKKHC